MRTDSIAIIGNGHIAKNILNYIQADVITRGKKLNKKYDVIINAAGVCNGNVIKENPQIVKASTDYLDSMILDYIKKNKCKFINISSSAVYMDDNIYSDVKRRSEEKHRLLKDKFIIDIRVFSFFSRYANLSYPFFMNDVANAFINNKTLITTKENIIRDYVHPDDLCNLINLCIDHEFINCAVDAYSKKPVEKFELLDALKEYGLEYRIDEKLQINSVTGNKKEYYHKKDMPSLKGYKPKFSSLETIISEVSQL